MVNLVILGSMYTEQSLQDAKRYSKTGVQMAPHIFLSTLIEGMSQLENIRLFVLNIPPVGSFPINYIRPIIRTELWGECNVQIGYFNFPIIKRVFQKRKLTAQIKKIISTHFEDETYVLVYNTYEPFVDVLKMCKKKYLNIKTGLLVTDCVPGKHDMDKYMTSSRRRLGKRIVRKAQDVDFFVLLTKYLADSLEINNKPFMIMECVCDEEQPCCTVNKISNNICLYTGTLEIEYGICELADAFAMMQDAELWICGDGVGRKYVEELTCICDNVKYFGFLEQDELKKIRNQCDYLINPRRPTGTYTKYSFPSKTAEYLMSGKPTIMYKLEGIPDEYDKYLNYLSGQTVTEIKDELEGIFKKNYSDLTNKALAGRQFMLDNKNARIQAKKILSAWGCLDAETEN